ncbi:MAG: RIO1 family regulatory kinase/ATPase [Acidimicrobiia bacterium]
MAEHQIDDEDDPTDFPNDSFEPRERRPRVRWDDDDVDPEETTYLAAEHGPEPVPDWVITAGAARQREHGKLKGGKEAEVFVVERTFGTARNLLAAKRYREHDDRDFRDDSRYRAARRTGDSRADRAVAKGTRRGMRFRGALWAANEWDVMRTLWSAGISVPYPVQKLGTEIMLEFCGDDRSAAPRLADASLDSRTLRSLQAQVVDAMFGMVREGVVHADLSPYNVLVWDGRAVLIDFPQAVHPQDGPDALALLQRDVDNLLGWFHRKGVESDLDALYRRLVAESLA